MRIVLRTALLFMGVVTMLTSLTGCPTAPGIAEVDFAGIPRRGYAPLRVKFDADVKAIAPYVLEAKFRDPGQPSIKVLSYVWTFGDGTGGTGKSPIHSYTQPGLYDVGVTVVIEETTPVQGKAEFTTQTSQITEYKEEYIEVLAPTLPPVADAGPDSTVPLNQPVTLDGTGSSDPDNDPLTFAWTIQRLVNGVPGDAVTVTAADTAFPTFTPDAQGSYLATLIVNDGTFDSLPDTAVITTDVVPPVLNFPITPDQGTIGEDEGEITLECGSDSFPDPTAQDDVEGDVTASIVVTGTVDLDTPGVYVLQYVASDSSGNTTSIFTLTVNVVDTTPPVITLIGAGALVVECGDPFTDPGATAADICDGALPVSVGGDTVITTAPGDYTITYNATDGAGLPAVEVTRTVTVVDTTPPVITLSGEAAITVECGRVFTDPGATVTDTCDDSVVLTTSGSVDTTATGAYVLTYDATDASGNMATPVTRTVTVADTVAPVITLVGDSTITVNGCEETFVDPGATAADNCDPDVPVVVGGDTVDTAQTGTYIITYEAMDDAGNVAVHVTRTVIVVALSDVTISLNGNAQMTVECSSVFTDPGAEAESDCDPRCDRCCGRRYRRYVHTGNLRDYLRCHR